MRIRLSVFAIALVVVANAVVLASVAWNRSGEPEAVLDLTERELVMPYARWAGRESTGVALSIHRTEQDYDWLDRDKLVELGFDLDRYERRSRPDRRAVDRRAHVVLEYDGPAFRKLLSEREERLESLRQRLDEGETNRRQVEAAEAALEQLRKAESRLVVIDAAPTAEALRERYPDKTRHAVMEALVHMRLVSRPGGEKGQVPGGRVGALLPGRVHVPRRFHSALREATDDRRNAYDAPPRYRVLLKFGRRGEPWVAEVEPLPAEGGSG